MPLSDSEPSRLDVAEPAELVSLIRSAARRLFWLNVLLVLFFVLAGVVGVAQLAGINARSPGWEPVALIAVFCVCGAGMVVALVGYSVWHVRHHRAVRTIVAKQQETDANREGAP